MLRIRPDQLEAFAKAELRKFEDWMVAHLHEFFPERSHASGVQRLRDIVQHGIARAATYGITSKRDVCKYIDLMMVLGRDFDRRQRFGARQILEAAGDPGSKIPALHRAVKSQLGRE